MTQATEGARVAPSVAAPPFGSGRLETTTLGPFELADGTRLPELVGRVSAKKWDADFLACTLAAIAAAKGQPAIAEAVLELTPEVAEDFMKWFYER